MCETAVHGYFLALPTAYRVRSGMQDSGAVLNRLNFTLQLILLYHRDPESMQSFLGPMSKKKKKTKKKKKKKKPGVLFRVRKVASLLPPCRAAKHFPMGGRLPCGRKGV